MPDLRPPWHYEDPLCAEVGTEIFFAPDKDDPMYRFSSGIADYRYAREICKKCPHQSECAEWGVLYETHGMWGGLTPQQRSRLRTKGKIRLPLTVKKN